MGNRAVITTRKDLKDIGVYLHWNGGRDSVEGFLTYCKIKGYCPPEHDNYGWAYLCTTIGNFFGQSGLSLGIDVASKLDCDNWDNGTYIIKDWKITRCKECGINHELVMLWDGHSFDKDVKTSVIDRGYTDYSEKYALSEAEKFNYEL